MRKKIKINIIGTPYTLEFQNVEDNPKLEDAYGLCEIYSKKLVIANVKITPSTYENVEEFTNKVIRHEVIHAFLAESGLRTNSDWAENEEMVDWFAIQIPKIIEVFKKLNVL